MTKKYRPLGSYYNYYYLSLLLDLVTLRAYVEQTIPQGALIERNYHEHITYNRD